jgi:hypothetical protein
MFHQGFSRYLQGGTLHKASLSNAVPQRGILWLCPVRFIAPALAVLCASPMEDGKPIPAKLFDR